MTKLYVCKKNDFPIKKLSKKLKALYPKLNVKQKGCLGKCKTCKSCPFLLVEGNTVKSKTTKKLSLKVMKQIVKS